MPEYDMKNMGQFIETEGGLWMQQLRLGLVLAMFAGVSLAQSAPLFKDEVLPVLEKNCTKCHGDQQKMGGLDLSTFSGVMAGGAAGR